MKILLLFLQIGQQVVQTFFQIWQISVSSSMFLVANFEAVITIIMATFPQINLNHETLG